MPFGFVVSFYSGQLNGCPTDWILSFPQTLPPFFIYNQLSVTQVWGTFQPVRSAYQFLPDLFLESITDFRNCVQRIKISSFSVLCLVNPVANKTFSRTF